MITQEIIQPLARYFNASMSTGTSTPVISISNAQMVRIVAHSGTLTGAGSAVLRVYVNTTNTTSGAVQLTSKAVTLLSDRTYEIFIASAEVYDAMERASYLFVSLDAATGMTAQIAIEISALPGRDIPASLPSNWTRVL